MTLRKYDRKKKCLYNDDDNLQSAPGSAFSLRIRIQPIAMNTDPDSRAQKLGSAPLHKAKLSKYTNIAWVQLGLNAFE